MTKSMTSSKFNISATWPRLVTKPIRSRVMVWSLPASMASPIIPCRVALDSVASFPPLSSRPFPLAMARADICGKESGRDSKMIINTPIGTVSCDKINPSASSRWHFTTPNESGWSAIWRKPVANVCNLSTVNPNRFNRGAAVVPSFAATSTSFWLAVKISSCRSTIISAMVRKIDWRTLYGKACNFRASLRAATALSRASLATFVWVATVCCSCCSCMASCSNSLPGVQNKVPRGSYGAPGTGRPNTARMPFKSCPAAMTQAPQFDPTRTADTAASILDPIPPRPCADFSPMSIFCGNAVSWLSLLLLLLLLLLLWWLSSIAGER